MPKIIMQEGAPPMSTYIGELFITILKFMQEELTTAGSNVCKLLVQRGNGFQVLFDGRNGDFKFTLLYSVVVFKIKERSV